MNCLRLTPPGELTLAIEDHDVEHDAATREHFGGDLPGALRHFIAELNAFASGESESLWRGVGAHDAARQILARPLSPSCPPSTPQGAVEWRSPR